jgi:hypothetical protein
LRNQPERHHPIGQLADGRVEVNFQTINPYTGAPENWEILAPWRANDYSNPDKPTFNPALPFDPTGVPLAEQFQISGLLGNDNISFIDAPYVAFAGTPAEKTIYPLDIGDLNSRSTDFVSMIDGGPDNDILRGTAGRDRIDGGSGDDILYGLQGDDRLWGNSAAGEGDISGEYDRLFGGRGDDA